MKPQYKPYTTSGYAWMNPSPVVKFGRRCMIWQLFKFGYYNIKIIRVLMAGH